MCCLPNRVRILTCSFVRKIAAEQMASFYLKGESILRPDHPSHSRLFFSMVCTPWVDKGLAAHPRGLGWVSLILEKAPVFIYGWSLLLWVKLIYATTSEDVTSFFVSVIPSLVLSAKNLSHEVLKKNPVLLIWNVRHLLISEIVLYQSTLLYKWSTTYWGCDTE